MMNLNIFLNKGDLLEKIPIIKAALNFQDIKKEIQFSAFRNELLSNGVGSWFYNGYFWALPVNDTINVPVIKPMASTLFSREVEWEKTLLEEFDSPTWFHLGISLVRDSIIYSLRKKFGNNSEVKIYSHYPDFTIYNKLNVAYSRGSAYVWTGLSIDKIIPVDNYNIAICPYLNYGVFEDNGRPVIDRMTKQKCLYNARKCSFDAYKSRFRSMLDLIFPIEAVLSNKKLLFNQPLEISVTQ
jgi:hypothetical protein